MARSLQQDARTGRYYVQITKNGIRKKFMLCKGEKDSRRKLNRIERDIASGTIQYLEQVVESRTPGNADRRDISLVELIVLHLEWLKQNRSENTFKYRQHYAFLFLQYLGLGTVKDGQFIPSDDIMVSEITRQTLREYQIWARNRGGTHPNAGNHAIRNVKTILLWGVEEELCELEFRKFPSIHEVPPKTKRIDVAHLKKLFDEAPADFVDMLKFALLTGLRPIEVCNLTVDQIVEKGTDRWCIDIESHKTSGRTKERKGRSVPLSDEARDIVFRQVTKHPQSEYVFLNDKGRHYTSDVFRRKLVRLCNEIGVPAITPYALRHTFASIQSDAHVETTALASLMGHSTTRTLMRYVSNSLDHHFDAVKTAQDSINAALQKIQVEDDKTGTQ